MRAAKRPSKANVRELSDGLGCSGRSNDMGYTLASGAKISRWGGRMDGRVILGDERAGKQE